MLLAISKIRDARVRSSVVLTQSFLPSNNKRRNLMRMRAATKPISDRDYLGLLLLALSGAPTLASILFVMSSKCHTQIVGCVAE